MSTRKRMHSQIHLDKQQGLSLVELLIAMTLGLFLIWGVTQSFLSSRQVYSVQQGLSSIQENSRMAQEFISYDIRNAGDYGCASGDSFVTGAADIRNDIACGLPGGTVGINMISSEASVDDDFKYAVYGFNDVADGNLAIGAAAGTLNPAPKVGTDVLMVHVAQEIGVLSAALGPPPTLVNIATLTLPAVGATPGTSQALVATDRISVSDCATTKIFGINAAVAINSTTITLGNNYCSAAAAFQAGASIRKLSTVYYYVAQNLRGGFSLYRAVGNASVTGAAADELLEGVEDMQLWFAIDNVGDADGVIDEYKTPDLVLDAEWNSWDWDAVPAHVNYSLVRAVRYSLLLSSDADNLLADEQQIVFNGVTLFGGNPVAGAGDRRLRQVVTSTVGIRSKVK